MIFSINKYGPPYPEQQISQATACKFIPQAHYATKLSWYQTIEALSQIMQQWQATRE